MRTSRRLNIGAGLALLLLAAVVAYTQTQAASAAEPPRSVQLAPPAPAAPQPDAAALKDGLAVRYYFAKFTHIVDLLGWMRVEDGIQGEPLPNLDYEDSARNVLTTTNNMLVGAHITGFIQFAEPGTHRLRVISNDGVRITLSGGVVFEDPLIHKATASPDLVFDVAETGWYPLDILYYQKKGTWALQLLWQPPGAEGFVPVPGSALRHL